MKQRINVLNEAVFIEANYISVGFVSFGCITVLFSKNKALTVSKQKVSWDFI